MNDSLDRSFGLVIAFLLPGFLGVVGLGLLSPTLAGWLSGASAGEPGLGAFLYVGLLSLAVGMIASAVRWLVIDTLHHWTGLKRPTLNFSHLQNNLAAFELAVHHNYRYYQFYANTTVSLCGVAACCLAAGRCWSPLFWAGFAALEIVLTATGRDSLRRYYERLAQILGTVSA
jgi:hypothetical protein